MRELAFSCTFNWVMGLVKSARQSGLRFCDMSGLLAEDMQPRKLWHEARTNPAWMQGTSGIKLLLTLIPMQYYLLLLLLKLFTDALNFVAPLLLGELVHSISSQPQNESPHQLQSPKDADSSSSLWAAGHSGSQVKTSIILAGTLFLVAVLKAVLDAQYTYHINRMSIRASGTIMQAPLASYLRKPAFVRQGFTVGHLQVLVSVDALQVPGIFVSSHALISLPLQIVAALVVLWWQVQAAFLAGLLLVIALIPVNRMLASTISAASQRLMVHKDRRLDVMSTLLANLRSLFMLGWQQHIRKQVFHHRNLELRELAVRKYVDAICVCTWALTASIFAASTFGLMAWFGQPLSPATVIVCLSLFGIIIQPLNSLPWVFNGVIEAWVSADRLATFLSSHSDTDNNSGANGNIAAYRRRTHAVVDASTVPHSRVADDADSDTVGSFKEKKSPGGPEAAVPVSGDSSKGLKDVKHGSVDTVIQMRSASFSWTPATETGGATTCSLCNLSFSVPKGSCFVVTGASGSGKSSLLSAILGDMAHVGGAFDICGSIALAPQQPWLIADTIQANVVMGRQLIESRYEAVLDACELLPDIRAMPNGDFTLVSDCGDNLSGGQQARISLARTLYGAADVYLLDAVLSALDEGVAAAVLRSILFSPLTSNSTIIFATQKQSVMESGDFVLHMDSGRIVSVVGQQGRHGPVQRPAMHPSLAHVQYGKSISMKGFNRSGTSLSATETAIPGACNQQQLDDLWAACSAMIHAKDKGPGAGAGAGEDDLAESLSVVGNVGTLGGQVSQGDPTAESRALSQDLPEVSDPFSLGLGNSAVWPEYSEGAQMLENMRESSSGNYGFFASFQVTPALERASTNLDQNQVANLPNPMDLASSNVSPAHGHRRHASGTWPTHVTDVSQADTYNHHRHASVSDTISLGGTASPTRANNWADSSQPFMGFPKTWSNMKPATGSGSASDLPLSTRAGDSHTPRLVNGLDAGSRQDGVCGGSSLHQSDSRVALQAFFDSEALDAEETSVYNSYMAAVGWPLVVVTLCSLILMQALKTLSDVYVTLWSDPQNSMHSPSTSLAAGVINLTNSHQDTASQEWPADSAQKFLKGLGLLTSGLIAMTCARAFLYAYAGLRAAKGLHQDLINAVLKADLSLLSRVPHGRVYARMSCDADTIDDSLPFIANILLASTAGFCAALLVMVACQPMLLLAVTPLAIFYFSIQAIYRVGARELRRLENTSMAPVHQFFSEGVSGAHVIRSLDLVQQIEFRMCEAVSTNMAARVANNALDAWLCVRLQICSALLVGALAFSAVLFHILALKVSTVADWNTGAVSPHGWEVLLTGLGLAYALPMVSLLSSMLTASAKVEQDMVSVERTLQFIHIPSARDQGFLDEDCCSASALPHGSACADQAQPSHGDASLSFSNVTLTYPGRRVPALDNVSFVLPAGKHVGICGRTGAGKSSLLNALFRLSSVQEGTIRIGHLDITELSARQLRQFIAVVPQKPVLMCGSVALNLDPFEQHTTSSLIDALRDVGLLDELLASSSCMQDQPQHHTSPHRGADSESDLTTPLLRSGDRPSAVHTHEQLLQLQIGGSAVSLSSAQQQLLCLARALLQSPSIMCLDEVSAHLSATGRAMLEAVIARKLRGLTTVRVTHDRSCLDDCDYIGVLSTGVMCFGPTEEMLKSMAQCTDLELIGDT